MERIKLQAAERATPRFWQVFVIVEHSTHQGPQRIRHAGLYLTYGNEQDVYYFDAVSDGSRFYFQWLGGFDPFRQQAVSSHIDVGPLAYSISGPDLVDVFRGVELPKPADDPGYNCQKWVQGALTKLYQRAYISYAQYAAGFMGLETDKVIVK